MFTGTFRRTKDQSNSSSPAPFFLQRPSIASELASRLIPIDVDLHTKKNMEEHSTNHYDISGLVLRRGQPFSFTVTFNRDYDPEQYQLYVRLAIGPRSMISKGTQIRILVDEKANDQHWSARIIPTKIEEDQTTTKKKNIVSLQIDSPSDAIIGKYLLLLEVRPILESSNKQDLTLFLFEIDIYFLYNPWNKEDACALTSSDQIAEYVMNEHGQIYLGSVDQPQLMPWYFGQFERSALLTALNILDQAQLPAQNRVDPSVILRILASKICSNPGANNGIFPSSFSTWLASSQNQDYTSSSAILNQYLSSNGRSVSGGHGTHWQHAAIFCTLSRALGIPCRIVTVYNAACRADGSENNDIHWDTKQRPLRQLNSDLMCSAHVWNECWMRRFDLPKSEHDWQILDSTPVQMCDGIRRTGPCSVSSLKKGEMGIRWDSSFIHSTINGKKNHWLVYPDGNMELLDVEKTEIGKKIVTRSVKKEFEAEDITHHYKHSDKSIMDFFKRKFQDDVEINLNIPDHIKFGDAILFEFNAKNKSNETRTLTVALTVCITSSAGRPFTIYIDQPIQTLNLESNKDGQLQLKISSDQYIHRGPQENIIVKYYLHCQVKQTDQIFLRDDSISFQRDDFLKPILDEDVVEIGQPVLLKIQIANTLSRPIRNGRIYIDGLGVNQILSIHRSFAPKESSIFQTKIYPRRIGVGRLYVSYVSADACSLIQSIPIEILSEPSLKKTIIETKTDLNIEKTSNQSQVPSVREEESKTASLTLPDVEHQSSKIIEFPSKSPSIAGEDDDDVDELYRKKKRNYLHGNGTGSTSVLHDSTLSLDKDKMSVDSLDISHDRRYLPAN